MGPLRGNAKCQDKAGCLTADAKEIWWMRKQPSPRRSSVTSGGVRNQRTGEGKSTVWSRARVSQYVLQKSKSCVWYRGSTNFATSEEGVHGCLGLHCSLRLTSGGSGVDRNERREARGWRQNHFAHPARSQEARKGRRRARRRDSCPGSRESSLRWKASRVVEMENLHGDFVEAVLDRS